MPYFEKGFSLQSVGSRGRPGAQGTRRSGGSAVGYHCLRDDQGSEFKAMSVAAFGQYLSISDQRNDGPNLARIASSTFTT
jgi:hypothetical protein